MSVYERIDEDRRPAWSQIGSAGKFRIEPDTDFAPGDDSSGRTWTMGRFDPHYHNAEEYWLISAGSGVIRIEDEQFDFGPGDIICIEGGKLHDVVGCYETVQGFWFSPMPTAGDAPHLYRRPEDEVGHVVPLLSASQSER